MRWPTWALAMAIGSVALRLGAAGGTIVDQAVTLTYPPTHWDASAPTDFVGVYPAAATDPVVAAGWWYRRNGTDTREYPFPAPDVESYLNGELVLVWNNVDGKGFKATETTRVFDNEGPSGRFLSEILIEDLAGSGESVYLTHYLDVDLPGHGDDDQVLVLAPPPPSGAASDHVLIFYSAYGGGQIEYRGDYARFRVAAAPGLLASLNDTAVTAFDNSGVPYGPGNAAAAFRWELNLHAFEQASARMTVAVRPRTHYVKGEGRRHTGFPALLFRRVTPHLSETHAAWDMRRTDRAAVDPVYTTAALGRVVGADDFDDDGATDLVQHDAASGLTSIHGDPVSGALPAPFHWRIEATGDFDLDGHPDLVWRSTSTRKVVIWRMDDTQRLGDVVPVPDHASDGNWEIVAALDFNHDGRRDLLWYNSSSGNAVIWYMNADVERIGGGFTSPASAGDSNWKIVAAGDYGKGPATSGTPVFGAPDIVWRNATSGRLVIWHMNLDGQRTSGVFVTPDPGSDLAEVVGPR